MACIGRAAAVVLAALAMALGGCASMDKSTRQRQVASMLAFLYPGKSTPDAPPDTVAVLNVPLRIGVAFVPDTAPAEFRLAETDRLQLAGRVREAFRDYPFVREIDAVPSLYLEPGGGFDNLERVASLLRLDLVALVSYDQVQHAGANKWSFLYWTGVGAYFIEGDEYDVLTAVEVAVLDVKSRRLLMHASGTSVKKGEATMVGFDERARQARRQGFGDALSQMSENLHRELKAFRERAPRDPAIRLVLPPGYDPAAVPPKR